MSDKTLEDWVDGVLGRSPVELTADQRAALASALGPELTAIQVAVIKAVVAQHRSDTLFTEAAGWGRLDETGLPVHTPMGVTRGGQGPADASTAWEWVCWCAEEGCSLTTALRDAREAGVRASAPAGWRARWQRWLDS